MIIKRYVNEGDIVEKGQLLFDIDPIDAKTQLDHTKRFSFHKLQLQAEVDGTEPDFSDDLMMIVGIVITELALFNARKRSSYKNSNLEQRKVQKLNEIQELKYNFKQLRMALI